MAVDFLVLLCLATSVCMNIVGGEVQAETDTEVLVSINLSKFFSVFVKRVDHLLVHSLIHRPTYSLTYPPTDSFTSSNFAFEDGSPKRLVLHGRFGLTQCLARVMLKKIHKILRISFSSSLCSSPCCNKFRHYSYFDPFQFTHCS